MIRIKVFVFNPFRENTYVLHDDTSDCIIVDPGCCSEEEESELIFYIKENKLKPVAVINTHTHIDHILGNNFIYNTYNIKPVIHEAGEGFLKSAPEYGTVFGLQVNEMIMPEKYLDEGDKIYFGHAFLEVLYTPGHADGSICLVSPENRFVITGDVLFNGSIGRTDLPTGNFDLLSDSITRKLYTLSDDYTVFPGHGPETSIGNEKMQNPYVMG